MGKGWGLFMLMAMLWLATPGLAQETLALGDELPTLMLRDLEGAEVDLGALALNEDGNRVPLVIVFWSFHCPTGARAMDRCAGLAAACAERGARFVGLCAYGESREEIAAYAREHGLDYLLLMDNGTTAGIFGADVVTTTVVIDEAGQLVYRGAIGTTEDGWPELALDALAAGLDVSPAETRARG